MKRARAGQLFAWTFTALSLAALVAVQSNYDRLSVSYRTAKRQAALSLSTPVLPSLTSLQILSVGNRPALADILWLETIQYFGSGSPYGTYPALGPILERITDLDPKFEYPYEFGLVVLPFMNQTDAAIRLGEKAQKELPGQGLLTYYLASDYQLNKKDYRAAARYYEKAASEPGAPAAASQLAGVSLSKLSDSLKDRLAAVSFWRTVYEKATTDDERERAKNWYVHMQMVYDMEQAAETYKADHGSFPPSLQALVDSGYLKAIPDSPINRVFTYHPDTGKVSFETLKGQ